MTYFNSGYNYDKEVPKASYIIAGIHPPPLHKGGFNFFKIDGNGGGGLKIFARKGGVRQNGRVCLEMGGLPYYIEVFLEIPHDAV